MDFATQANSIRALTEKYHVEYIALMRPASGRGVSACPLVLPGSARIRYTPEVKTAMVLKAKDTIARGCLEYDARHRHHTVVYVDS
jgi:hypothetical protein